MEYGMPDTKIVRCDNPDCKSEFQDQKYGPKMRVHNHAPNKGVSKNRYRCTTCKKETELKG